MKIEVEIGAAIVDRLTFGGNIIETGTGSYRLAQTRARTEKTTRTPASSSGCQQHSFAEQVEAGSTVHLSFDHLDAVGTNVHLGRTGSGGGRFPRCLCRRWKSAEHVQGGDPSVPG
ncbi:hypothetical protein [Actinoplanes hulinensis]|uniref:hypothetical protein n=1 Tax=Actinoplanes hulinensis TaxID=1144547 RepID=UPI002484A9E8|nr:hypothetical protein [Actinoplanes hulinensis]